MSPCKRTPTAPNSLRPNARKLSQLLADLRSAGFQLERQSGSHRQFKHPSSPNVITLVGAESHDAKRYQERQVAEAIAKSKTRE